MPIRPPNGAWWRRRSTPRWSRSSTRGTRTIAAADFFAGIMTTALAEDELLTEVRLPLLPADTRFGFYEFSPPRRRLRARAWRS